MIPLNELPDDVLELIRGYYLASRRADEKRDNERNASALLQACLRRHLTQRCDDPAHAGFVTYTPRRVPCYFALPRRHARAPAAPRVPGGPGGVLLARIYEDGTKMAPRFS